MRVLFIAYYFPPDPAVGAIRAGAVFDAFRRAGHEVTVISNRIDGATAVPPVHRVRTLPNPREIFLSLSAPFRRGRRVGAGTGAIGYRPPDAVPSWKRFLVAMALMPDDYHGFIGPAIVRAIPAIRRGVDLVYTSGPPHSMHLVGLALRKLTRVRWAAEFRDPWIDNANQPRYARSRTADRIRAWLERLCLENADFLISATASAGRNLARRTGREDILVARTGIAADTLAHGATSQPHAPTSERRILYMGNLYHQRDPRPLFHAIAALRERGELPAAGVRIDLYGDCEWFHDVSVTGAARDAGIGDLVHVHGRVPLDQARQFIRDADLLLLLAQDQPVQVPQKLFEYLAVQRPIIAFADAGSETADILESLGGHTIISDPADAAPALRRALQQHDFARPDPVAFAELSADRQMDVLVRRIEEARRPADRGMMRPSHASRVG